MYFNKAEGCYKYNPRVCLWSLLHSFLKKNFITNEQKKLSVFFFYIYTSFPPLEEMLV